MDLFEQVLHAIEGEETEGQTAHTTDGQKFIQVRTFGPDRWIQRAEQGRLDAINFLAVILFAVRDTFNLEHERRIVEEWAKTIRAAAMAGKITPRDPVSLLPLQSLPDGWNWLVSLDDADSFVNAQGMGWSCTEQVKYLATQSTHPSIALIEQNPQLYSSKRSATPQPSAPSRAPLAQEPESPPLVSNEHAPRPNLFALPGVNTTDIIDAFGLVGKKWTDIRKTGRYWKAIHTQGGRGKPMHTWKPADFAICLLKTGERKLPGALRAIITSHWPEWLPEFESQLEDHLNESGKNRPV